MEPLYELFFSLIRVAIGTQDTLPHIPSKEQWKQLYDMAKKQSLVGIAFAAIQKLGASPQPSPALGSAAFLKKEGKGVEASPKSSPKGKDFDLEPIEVLTKYWNMPEMLYLKWMGMAAKIQQRNEAMNGYTQEVLAHFRKEGFACTILKGQGIAALYGSLSPRPLLQRGSQEASNHSNISNPLNLSLLRQSGDVDVWVAGGRKALYDHSIKMFGKLEGLTYHHIHYPMYENVEVEAHVWPSFLSSPLRNKRLQKFCMMYEPKDGCEDTPSLAFNRVFILLHCYQHFTRRGVGMRQLLDYYFVLKEASLQLSPKGKRDSVKWIKKLGMERFAEAMMWVMKEVLGLDEQYLLCEPNEEYGRFLLDEVMETGNMGHADERVDKKQLLSAGGRYLNNLKRDIRIVKICPHEALWEPIWGIYQFAWCKLTLMKYKR